MPNSERPMPPNVRAAIRERQRRINSPAERVDVRIPELLPHQKIPAQDGTFHTVILTGGRGAGKSAALSTEAYRHFMFDPPCDPEVQGGHRGVFIAPTLGDATEAFESPAGLKQIDSRIKMTTSKGSRIIFPNGSRLRVLGAYTKQDAERLRAATNN